MASMSEMFHNETSHRDGYIRLLYTAYGLDELWSVHIYIHMSIGEKRKIPPTINNHGFVSE